MSNGNKPQQQQAKGNAPAPAKNDAPAPIKTKRERFVEVAPKRTRNVLRQIELLSNCGNKGGYEYTTEDVAKIFSAIQKKLDACKAKFDPSASSKKTEELFTL